MPERLHMCQQRRLEEPQGGLKSARSHAVRGCRSDLYNLPLSAASLHSLQKAAASAYIFCLLSVKTFLLSIEKKSLSPGPVTKTFEGTAQASQKKKKKMPTQTNTSTRHIIDILIHGLHPNFKGTFN